MNFQTPPMGKVLGWCASLVATMLLLGCATSSRTWDNRIGTYTWEDALAEFGPPDRVTEEAGGVKAAEWITPRTKPVATPLSQPSADREATLDSSPSYASGVPDWKLRLSFTPDGKLIDWKRSY